MVVMQARGPSPWPRLRVPGSAPHLPQRRQGHLHGRQHAQQVGSRPWRCLLSASSLSQLACCLLQPCLSVLMDGAIGLSRYWWVGGLVCQVFRQDRVQPGRHAQMAQQQQPRRAAAEAREGEAGGGGAAVAGPSRAARVRRAAGGRHGAGPAPADARRARDARHGRQGLQGEERRGADWLTVTRQEEGRPRLTGRVLPACLCGLMIRWWCGTGCWRRRGWAPAASRWWPSPSASGTRRGGVGQTPPTTQPDRQQLVPRPRSRTAPSLYGASLPACLPAWLWMVLLLLTPG